ncbi:hypothetical protein M514_23729 [Trichuris suis]|uniref:Uncharacterized protein n=1 Tax=Trichuris suis TaxID=68888 RepID=A0A085MQ59_9BILA|nr:hypothetical protein M514_28466 [Trichuris suis]KFD64019.1 hypothetical protein M514_23729 [Trichuris suis]
MIYTQMHVTLLREGAIPTPFVSNDSRTGSNMLPHHRDVRVAAAIFNLYEKAFTGFTADSAENPLLGVEPTAVTFPLGI